MENLKNPDKKKDIARKATEITLKKIRKYEDLSAPSLEEGDKVFKEKTRELWKHFAVQGSIGKEGILPFAGDLDAKGSLYLLRLAGILSPKNFEVYERTLEKKQDEEHPRTELKYKGNKDMAKKSDQTRSVKVISFVPAGDVLRGAIHLDTGNKEGIVTEEDATAYFDHHGAESDLSSSATKKLYEGLTALGMLEKDRNLERVTEFITQIDNGTFPDAETYFPVFDKTVIGLQRFISPESLYKLFQDDRKPTDLLSDKALERYGLKKGSARQKELQEKCKKEIVKLREEGFVVDTKNGGKALINIGKRWPGDYLAAKYFKCNTYVIWSPERQSFFVSNNENGLEFDLPQGVNVRGKMWIKSRTDGKPLEISLKDILGRIAPPDFKPQGKLAKYLESEGVMSYNTKDMNPELSKKPAPPTAETTPPPFTETSLEFNSKASDADIPSAPKPLDLPTTEAKEVVSKKSQIEMARLAYLEAKNELDSRKKNSEKDFPNLTREQREDGFSANPVVREMTRKFDSARMKYFDARSEELGKKLEELESEFKTKGLTEEELAKEMKKASSAYLVSEFKNLYDAQTEILASARQESTAQWLAKKIYQMGDEYRKLPLKKKLVYSAALIGSGVVAGSIGGTVGTALAAIVGGGHLSQRILGGVGAFVGLEGLIKKSQEGEFSLKESAKFSEVSEKAVEGAFTGKKEEFLAYLKSRDNDLESMGWVAEKDVREVEKNLANRRYLVAGSMGALMGLGATTEALSNVFNGFGLNEAMEKISAKLHYSEVEPASGDESPAKIIEEVSKESRSIATIEKGGSVSQAAHSLVKEGRLSTDQFKQAWENSFVDIKGVKVPIKDISLVHAGDQVVYIQDASGSGHFEVVDYAKDKLGLGTNQNLYALYDSPDKHAPVWLEKAVVQDVQEAFKDNSLDANDSRVVEFYYKNGSLEDQMAIQEKLMDKMTLSTSDARPFSEMFVKLSSSPEHEQAMRIFGIHLGNIGFGSPDSAEFSAIKDVKVGDLLEKRGGSWFKDYFFASELTDKNGEKVAKVGMGIQRKLVEYIKLLVSADDKQLTVEQFLRKLS